MVDVSGEANDGSAERKEEAPPSKRVQTMPTLPTPPVFRGSTAQDKQMFMKKYEAYYRQLSALETAFFRPFRMPVGACVEDERRRLIAQFDICKPLDDITEEDWIDYFLGRAHCG
ncbi:DEAD-box ATP-dependent RNA helicase 36 [Phytophthora cinnamomi]|nr:DEAD-box ATP-dependent RNA helicase 36 [Phytophthora cinnamomi]